MQEIDRIEGAVLNKYTWKTKKGRPMGTIELIDLNNNRFEAMFIQDPKQVLKYGIGSLLKIDGNIIISTESKTKMWGKIIRPIIVIPDVIENE